MKKLILITGLFLGSFALAQAPEKMSYQAVVRNATGQLVQNQNVGIKASVLQNSATGTVVYSESLTGTTNANGLVSLAIGSGTVLSGTFSSIDWSTGNYYLKTETDPTGGTNYTIAGTSQLLSVPYAMYAKSAGGSSSLWTELPPNMGRTSIMNTNNGDVGIGTNLIGSPLTVKARPSTGFSDSYVGYTQVSADGNTRLSIFTTEDGASLRTTTNHNLYLSTYAPGGSVNNMTLQKVTGNVGIGTSNPSEKLEVSGKTKTTNLQVTSGSGLGKILTSDAGGNATWQTSNTNTAFKARLYNDFALTSVGTFQKIAFDAVYFNDGFNFESTSSYEYTIPSTGVYQFNVNISFTDAQISSLDGIIAIRLKSSSSTSGLRQTYIPVHAGAKTASTGNISATEKLEAGEKITLEIYKSINETVTVDSISNFSGHKVY